MPAAVGLVLPGLVVALAWLRARLDPVPRARRVYDAASALESALIVALLLMLVVVGVAQIVLRNASHRGLVWADPLMRHAVLWIGALGGSAATARMRHINIDVFGRLVPPRLRPWRRALVYGATAVTAWLLAVASWRLVLDERAFGETAFAGVPTWVTQAVLPWAFGVVAYRSLVNLFLGREGDVLGAEAPTGADAPAPEEETP